MAIDLKQLEAAVAILTVQWDQAPLGPMYEELERAVNLVERVKQRVYVEQTVRILRPRQRIEVTDELLRKMLANGLDLWVADLLAWGRSEVRNKRRKLGMIASRAGGGTIGRAYRRRSWSKKWQQQLQELGLWPD